MTPAARLAEILESFRMTKHVSDPDGFYTCPCHPGYANKKVPKVCACGYEENQRVIDEALGLVKEMAEDIIEVVRI